MKTACILLITFLSLAAAAQDYTQTVKGKITDTDSKVTLPGANVILLGSNPLQGTISDLDGNFKLEKVPVGRHSFKISFLGYEDVTVSEILIGTGREVFLGIEMKESVTEIAEVKIVANVNKSEAINQMVPVSATQLTVESTSRIAAGINDPGRTAQSFAGVSTADDENNELVIRGNSPRGVSWRMEGIEIPNPNHFTNGEGGSGGGVCALSTQVMANSDFLTGAFPAEYGNALSGVFDLSLRAGNSEKREYALQLGMMGAQVAMEGPIRKGSGSSYLFNYRNSTLKWLGKIGIIDLSGGEIAPEWQDLSYKLYVPTEKYGRFSFWGLGGMSTAGNYVVRDTSQWEFRSSAFEDREYHTIGIAGITHNYLLKNNKTYIKTVAAYSFTNDEIKEDTLSYDYAPTLVNDEHFTYFTFSASSFINHKLNAKNVFRAGAVFHHKKFDLKVLDYDFNEKILENKIEDKGSTCMLESFVQWQHRVNEKLDINSGVHATYLALSGLTVVEPRIGARWRLNERHMFTVGSGLHSRTEPVSIYLAESQLEDGRIIHPNEHIKLTRSAHLVAGYNWNISPDLRIKTEAYYQYLFDVPVKQGDSTRLMSALNFTSGFTNEKLVNEGTGRNYGIELTIEKFFSENWYMLATASLFESKFSVPGGIERNTLYNSKYVFNVAAGKEFRVGRNKQNIIGANIRTMWRGGYRTIPVDLEASRAKGYEVQLFNQAFETKSPDYFRVDLGISYHKNNPNWSWVVSFDIQNVTDRKNFQGAYYNPEIGDMVKVSMVGMVPVLNYRIEF